MWWWCDFWILFFWRRWVFVVRMRVMLITWCKRFKFCDVILCNVKLSVCNVLIWFVKSVLFFFLVVCIVWWVCGCFRRLAVAAVVRWVCWRCIWMVCDILVLKWMSRWILCMIIFDLCFFNWLSRRLRFWFIFIWRI